MKLAVLGIGSVRCGAPIIGSLGSFFGERPLDITFWDADMERLDLFDRFARLCFRINKASHGLSSLDDPGEALEGAQAVVLAIGGNCAFKYLRGQGSILGHGETDPILIRRCSSELLNLAGLDAQVLSLIEVEPDGREWQSLEWPPEPSEADRRALPHQILRYLNGDEYPHAFLRDWSTSPMVDWLNRLPTD